MIGETGERKSAVATPDGKSRKKKKKKKKKYSVVNENMASGDENVDMDIRRIGMIERE